MACNKADVKAKLMKAFQEVDRDHNGTIDGGELEQVLKAYYKATGKNADAAKIRSEAASFMQDVDKNRDNKINLDEFITYFMQFCGN